MRKSLDDMIDELVEKISELEKMLDDDEYEVEFEIEELQTKLEELEQQRQIQWKKENEELERQYWATQF